MRKITILLFCIMLLITLLNCATSSYSQNATVESESKFVGTRAAIGEGNLDCAEGCTDTPPTEEER